MQDTATNAMTELALGLSMAFFSLLVVALLSFGAKDGSDGLETSATEVTRRIDSRIEIIETKNTQDKKAEEKAKEPTPLSSNTKSTQWLIFYKDQFYDEKLTKIKIEHLEKDQPVVIAVAPSLSFKEASDVYLAVSHPQKTIALLDEQWLSTLKQVN